MQNFLHGAVQAGNFASPAAYIESLLAQTKNRRDELEAKALEGLQSGDCLPWNRELKQKLRKEVAERLCLG
jgi:hypothetical protein